MELVDLKKASFEVVALALQIKAEQAFIITHARAIGVRPKTLVTMVERAFPGNVVEQRFCVAIMGDLRESHAVRIKPESIYKLLREWHGERELWVSELNGEHEEEVKRLLQFIEDSVLFEERIRENGIRIGITVAAKLYALYGQAGLDFPNGSPIDCADNLVESVLANIDAIRRRMRWRRMGDKKAAGMALDLIAKHGARSVGSHDITEFFDGARHGLYSRDTTFEEGRDE